MADSILCRDTIDTGRGLSCSSSHKSARFLYRSPTYPRRLPSKSLPVHRRSINLSVKWHCTRRCAVHRELHYTQCKKMNHGKSYSQGFCCVVAGVLSDVSNKIRNEGVNNSKPSACLVRITVMNCFETSVIPTQWHGANSTDVTARTSQGLLG